MLGRRVNAGLLNRLERPLIRRAVSRIPAFVNPAHLSLLALIGAGIAALSLIACRLSGWFLIPVVIGLALHWFGDSLDGALARYRKCERPRVGFLIDRCGDVSSFSMLILGLGFSPFLELRLALMLLVAYLMNSIYALMKLVIDGVHLIGPSGIGATEGRIVIAAWAIVFQAIHLNPSDYKIDGISPFDLGCGISLGIVLVIFAVRVGRDIERQKQVELVLAAAVPFSDRKVVALARATSKFPAPRVFEVRSMPGGGGNETNLIRFTDFRSR